MKTVSKAQLARDSKKLAPKNLRQWGHSLVSKGFVKPAGTFYVLQTTAAFDQTEYLIGCLSDQPEILSRHGRFNSPDAALKTIQNL
jgi:hypothetical protein